MGHGSLLLKMLRELHVKNYALMEDLTIEFEMGLNLLTGETGVGKSTLIGALGFLLGEKGDVDLIRTGEEKVSVEGVFEIPKEMEKSFKEVPSLDSGETLILKRILSRTGKSQSYLNESPIPLSLTKKIGDHLLDIHGQHEHQSLLRVECHLQHLDHYARLVEEREEVRKLYFARESLSEEIREGEKRKRALKEKEELLRYQWDELEKSGIEEKEDLELEREKGLLENSETLQRYSEEISERLTAGEGSIGEQLGRIRKLLEEMADLDPHLKEHLENARTLSYQVEDLWRSLGDYGKKTEFDPVRLEQVNDRLDLLTRLKKKYGSALPESGEGGLGSILEFKKRLETDLKNLDRSEDESKLFQERLREVERNLVEKTLDLSLARGKGSKELESRMEKELKTLGMEGSSFSVQFQRSENPEGLIERDGKRYEVKQDGMDVIEFLLSTNSGEDLKPLRKVASGGEISRIMLALKSLLVDEIPTLIFDEVDVGIGGKMAEVIGEKLKILSRKKQVICITHLPQIASRGEVHYQVIKKKREGRTITQIIPLRGEERKREIARMMGGPDRIALEHAEEMLKTGRK